MKLTRKIILGVLCCAALITAIIFTKLSALAKIGVGYQAKVACSEIFVAGRGADSVIESDFFGIHPLMERVGLTVDDTSKTVKGSLYGLGAREAVYHEGAGCTLRPDGGVVASQNPIQRNITHHEYGVQIKPEVQTAVEALFSESALANPIHTRSALVIQDGVIIAERYAEGFDKNTPQQSWSMAKSVTQALIGTAKLRGYMAPRNAPLMPEWAGDERAAITLTHLLQMESGLEFVEDYGNTESDVNMMLWRNSDLGAFAASKPLAHAPGAHWEYSSGTSNLVSKILRQRLEAAGEDYPSYPQRALFDPLGIDSAVFEVDGSGTFIGSSFVYATARDWGRLGQLYLQDGVWGDKRILPEGWAQFAATPNTHSAGQYGAHWWLNVGGSIMPGLPEDLYYMGGHEGQYVIVIPSKNAVIIRMGIMRPPASFDAEMLPLLRGIAESL